MRFLVTAVMSAALMTVPALASQITAIADAQRGTMVTVEGVVERITDEDDFRLTDASGSIRIYVGETVTVDGFVDDDIIGPREIYARSLTRSDGTVITFDRRYE